MSLKIENFHVTREGKEIVKGVTLEIPAGEVHALMGPNGSGKSSLANALMGHPKYEVTGGSVLLDGDDVTALKPNEKAAKGLFLSMQHPPEVPGVSVSHFLRVVTTTSRREPVSVADFRKLLKEKMADLKIDPAFMNRSLNEGFSGGEKKRMEILQLALLEPKYAILDETDSGLDVDALKIVTEGVSRAREKGMGVLLITHYTRILKHLVPDRVHVLSDGAIVKSGGKELAEEIEREGYAFLGPKNA
ncbi:MAG TPA: Fe-S cluster assembly ATPase SufC [Candidatus Eisenbacteria bacterium]|nr:Fe-S cluster assembly ATPase SufC [Candidatus Eisenbacteria bacterium]